MKYLLSLLFITLLFKAEAQDFKFHGKSKKAIITQYNLGEDEPFASEEDDKKVAVQFDGRKLNIGKNEFKYMWHQNSKDMSVIQLNCIERVEDGNYPYQDAKFEVSFKENDKVEITQFIPMTPTTEKRIKYLVDIEKTTNLK